MYAKVFSQILDSSIAEDWITRHVFMDFLVLADKDGVVDMTVAAIARRTNAPVDVVEAAISKLTAKDLNSRSHAEEGRRIIPLDGNREWGWKVVNYVVYCKLRDEPTRKQYMRDYMKERRQRERELKQVSQVDESIESGFTVNPVNSVNLTLANVPVPVSKELSTATKSPSAKNGTRIPEDFCVTEAHREFARTAGTPTPDSEIGRFKDYWEAKAGRDAVKLDWNKTFQNWLRNANGYNRGPVPKPKVSPTRYAHQGNSL